jgi:hypothetical protein
VPAARRWYVAHATWAQHLLVRCPRLRRMAVALGEQGDVVTVSVELHVVALLSVMAPRHDIVMFPVLLTTRMRPLCVPWPL